MKNILILLIFMCSPALALSQYQKNVIKKSYNIGKKYDLGNTLAGIALVESQAGIYKVNSNTEDYGVTGINIKSLLARIKLPDTYLNRSKYATYLVLDDEYAIKAALAELIYWRDSRRRTNWASMVNSFNQGSILRNNHYARKVARAIKTLKKLNMID